MEERSVVGRLLLLLRGVCVVNSLCIPCRLPCVYYQPPALPASACIISLHLPSTTCQRVITNIFLSHSSGQSEGRTKQGDEYDAQRTRPADVPCTLQRTQTIVYAVLLCPDHITFRSVQHPRGGRGDVQPRSVFTANHHSQGSFFQPRIKLKHSTLKPLHPRLHRSQPSWPRGGRASGQTARRRTGAPGSAPHPPPAPPPPQ